MTTPLKRDPDILISARTVNASKILSRIEVNSGFFDTLREFSLHSFNCKVALTYFVQSFTTGILFSCEYSILTRCADVKS